MPSGAAAAGRRFVIPSLDGLRFVAILIVVWGHADLPFQVIGETHGVTLFFFLSGYLITTLLRREYDKTGTVSIKDFYLRRIFRIFPPLYIVVTVMVVLSLLQVLENRMTGMGVASAYGFFQNYFILIDGRDGLVSSMNALWSLAVEEHYYLVFPILYLVLRRFVPSRWVQAGVLAAICVAILGWRIWLAREGASWDRLYLATDTRADTILWGSIMALVLNPMYDEVRRPKRTWPLTVLFIVSALAFWGIPKLGQGMTIGYTLQAFALVGVFVPVILAPTSVIGRFLNWKPVAWIGVLSYSIYLIHRPALNLAEEYLPAPHLVQVAVALTVTVLLSWAMNVVVERPFARLRSKISHAQERTGDAVPSAGGVTASRGVGRSA